MRFLLCTLSAAALAIGAPSASAQNTRSDTSNRASTLSLDDAIATARRNNYQYLSSLSQRELAVASARTAYGQFLPSSDASFSVQRQQGGRQIFNGGSFGATSDVNQSQYRLGFGYRLAPSNFLNVKVAGASRDATEANISAASENLRSQVTQQYLTVLQAQARSALADTLVSAAQAQLVLAQARALVGSGTQIDVSRAEVALGQQQVQQLQARNQIQIEKLRLFQQMGVEMSPDVILTSTFPVTPPNLNLVSLLGLARQQNPGLLALRARERVSGLNVSKVRSEYMPSLTLSTGISGYTYAYTNPEVPVLQAQGQTDASRVSCIRTEEVRAALNLSNNLASCNSIVLTEATAATLRTQNDQFPFDFTKSPRSISATLSLPIFDGFAREQRMQEAMVERSNARNQARSEEIALTSGVTAAYLTLNTALQTVTLQEQNSAKALQELKFMQDRYRAGTATFVDLTESRAAYERAESDRINAVYDYHKAYTLLENAVGRPLR